MPMTQLQKNFQSVMDETGLSQTAWSRKAGLGDSAVKNVMQGKSESPRGNTLTALAKAAGVPVLRLIAGTSPDGDAEVGGDISQEDEDALLLAIWGRLHPDVKEATLTLIKTINRVTRQAS
jgi:transcriptional regulator with XRE-family HTH domain